MINITLADGSKKQFAPSVTIFEIAKSISSSLAQNAIAGCVDGVQRDLSFVINHDCQLTITTRQDKLGLEIIRHSTAHLLAHAVKLLYPNAQVTIGPVIDDGFYYDFSYKQSFVPDDLAKIEAKMHELVKANLTIKRQELSRLEAITYFKSIGEHYKAEIVGAIPETEVLSLYSQGEFSDLCRGPHVPRTGVLRAFKLTKIAGAYWRGDSNNEMLQRIYGTAWATQEQLDQHLTYLEEAQKRDHRKLAKQLDLFHLQDEAPGMVFWHPRGYTIWQLIEQYIRQEITTDGYLEVKTPQLLDAVLWKRSGHLDNYSENMFLTSVEARDYAFKPMNCPCHVLLFNQKLVSYRDLPLRFAEFGCCHRNEPSGSLHGLMRVRGFVQDDAHIFCTLMQVNSEAERFIVLLQRVYQRFGFSDIEIRLATRPAKSIGDDQSWLDAEKFLAVSLDNMGLKYIIAHGEGAFYGPKIEFHLRDSLNRLWQCGTLQLDFNLPKVLGASYIDADGNKKTPIMLHRAILGTFERFIGILIEHYAGKLPLWLTPVQIAVLNISEKQYDYAQTVTNNLQKLGWRVLADLSNEKISYKIRQYTLEKIPYLVILGASETDAKVITVRKTDGTNITAIDLAAFDELLKQEL